jgi:Flp pilus assembly protein TadG
MSRRTWFGMAALRRLWRDRRGIAVPLVAVSAVVLFGMAGVVMDVGAAYETKVALQAATDAAAIAAAQDINCTNCTTGKPLGTATQYSSTSGNLNTIGKITATMVSGYPQLKCFTSTGVACVTLSNGNGGTVPVNGIVVKQTASVPTTFARVLGINQFTITTTSTAGMQGGQPKPLNVMIILDTTRSMQTDNDPACGNPAPTKLVCAEEGVQEILSLLSAKVDNIGLMIFPGLNTSTPVSDEYNCGGQVTASNLGEYVGAGTGTSPVYQIVGLSNNYQTGASQIVNGQTQYTLSGSSNLVQTVGGGGASGLCAPGGKGTYFADAITAAQSALVANAKPGTQNVMILLSDGAANADPGSNQIMKVPSVGECHQAVLNAQAATAAGTWVYALAYQSPSTGCTEGDTGSYTSPCYTMQNIASDPTKFYSDNSSCPSSNTSISGLLAAFQALATSLLPPRLLPDNTT